jgi:hypothetical protein
MSSADDIREQFETSRRVTKARQTIREHLRKGQGASAAAIARALGIELPEHQVVRVEFGRARP